MSVADGKRPPMSLRQQAEFVGELARRCVLSDGTVAKETFLSISQADAEDMRALSERLHRMALHEREIRKLVTGR